MGQYNNLQSLKNLIIEGEKLGLDFSALEAKINECLKNQESGVIKIVLLGSFSDGKTTAIAGLLGKLENNMKIDEDESSDELSVYHIDGLGKQYEIVDTPGLFGTKEKEIEGVNVKFSDITEKFISEAHILIYVCNSVNTLKDSHKDIIRKVLRDYNKLGSTIFVINRMDDVADTNDEEEYAEVSAIKRSTFIDRLRQVIGLTPDEERRLNIACIAANPKSKGLDYWFAKPDEYKRRSHISQLESCVSTVVAHSSVASLQQNTNVAVAKDLVQHIALSVSSEITDLSHVVDEVSSSLKGMETDLAILRQQIAQSKSVMLDRLDGLRKDMFGTIDHIGSLQDMHSFLETHIGITQDKLDFNLIITNMNAILSECGEANNAHIQTTATEFERSFNGHDELLDKAVKSGLGGMKNVNNHMVLKARDIFFKGFKFKPYGAIKVAKYIGNAAVFLGVAFDAWNLYKKYKAAKKLEECRTSVKNTLTDIFGQVFQLFNNEEDYYKNFAPSYLELHKAVKDRKGELKVLSDKVSDLKTYKSHFKEWFSGNIEDAVFEEVR